MSEKEQREKERREKERRAALIRQALARLGGDGSDGMREKIEWAMRSVERQRFWKASGRYGIWTAQQKIAAKQFALALRKVQNLLKDPRLADDVRSGFPLDKKDFDHWIERANAAAGTTLSSRTDPDDVAGRRAEKEALRLLNMRGLKAPLTRNGRFCELAAIIYGEPDADMLQFCRSVRRLVGAK